MSISSPPADDDLPEGETPASATLPDSTEYGSLSIEDDPEGTVDPGELAGGASEDDEDVS
ncbi:hypothetical protein [uncultured Friedmanniella sp.]|uniref:hypothetical protein n=1 Tax=uncultured Friedmanniella sp. TaxID=335381 RepID=UPI0035CCA82D